MAEPLRENCLCLVFETDEIYVCLHAAKVGLLAIFRWRRQKKGLQVLYASVSES